MFVLNSDITIGKFRWSGVHDVRIRRSVHSYADSAVIVLPGRSAVQKGTLREDGTVALKAGSIRYDSTGNLFAAGDMVTIKLGYNGDLREEFVGFVRRVGRGTPVQVECEGYVQQLRSRININGVLQSTTVKSLLEMAVGKRDVAGKGLATPLTDISVVCDVDVPLGGLELTSLNGAEICDYIKKVTDNNLAIFFISPKVLWCGLLYTPYADGNDPLANGAAKYRPGYNLVQDGGLQERVVNDDVQVLYGGKYATGTAVWTAGKKKTAANKLKTMLNNIPSEKGLQVLAAEKELRLNYRGYEGWLNGFLQPYCLPGYKIKLANTLYPDMNGDYLAEETEVRFGVGGARRRVKVGPKISLK